VHNNIHKFFAFLCIQNTLLLSFLFALILPSFLCNSKKKKKKIEKEEKTARYTSGDSRDLGKGMKTTKVLG